MKTPPEGTFRWVTTMIVAAALALTACSVSTDPRGSDRSAQDTDNRIESVRLAGSNIIGYPNPFGPRRGPTVAYGSLLFDTLLWKDDNGVPQPWLATKYEVSPDGKTWRFTLHDDVKWQDGQPFTADDVAFTWNYMTSGPGKASGGYSSLPVKSVVAESPTVVVFQTDPVYAPFLDRVASRLFILPRHVWEPVTDPAKFRDPTALMGTGAYRLESFDETAGNYLFVANDSYFLGPPHVKRVEFVPAPNELLALQQGAIDAASLGAGAVVDNGTPDEALTPFKNDEYGTLTAPGQVGRALHFNMNQGFPYSDVRFRQAVAYAVDRQDLLKRILLGRGEVGNLGVLEPSNSPFFAKDTATYGFDLAKAKGLLDEIGLKDATGDGVRDLSDGKPFTPELLTNSTWNAKTADAIKEYLRAVGIDVRIKSQDQATADATTKDGRYEMALIGYGFSSDPDGLRTQFSSKLPASSFASVHGYDNPAFEDLAAKQLTVVDQAERIKIAQEMQRMLANDVPIINLYVAARMVIFDKSSVTNWFYGGGIYPGLLNKEVFITGKKPA